VSKGVSRDRPRCSGCARRRRAAAVDLRHATGMQAEAQAVTSNGLMRSCFGVRPPIHFGNTRRMFPSSSLLSGPGKCERRCNASCRRSSGPTFFSAQPAPAHHIRLRKNVSMGTTFNNSSIARLVIRSRCRRKYCPYELGQLEAALDPARFRGKRTQWNGTRRRRAEYERRVGKIVKQVPTSGAAEREVSALR